MAELTQTYADEIQQILAGGNYSTIIKLLRKTPLSPPNSNRSATLKFTGGDTLKATPYAKLEMSTMEKKICFIKLKPAGGAHTGALTFEIKTAENAPTTADRAGWIACWFLPWQSARLLRLDITNVSTAQITFPGTNIAPVPNPGIFFTASINGCSVFAVGNQKSPQLYHGGIDPEQSGPMPLQANETTEAAWRRLVGPQAVGTRVRDVGKDEYISELNANPANNDDRTRTTTLATRFEADLQRKGNLTNLTVRPWGAVFGVRSDNGNWHMTLVKNCTTQCERVAYQKTTTAVQKRFLRRDKVTTTVAPYDRKANEILVLGGGIARVDVPVLTSVNLGFREFYPGVGVEHARDMTNVSVF